jgi:2',3'-cyclic-nucleotide 2'-phosphodiesterase (5'-nucleotidase family)
MPTRSRLRLTTLVALLATIVLATSAVAQTATVTFLHLNDVYEISPKQGRGGFAPLMTLLTQERAAAPGAITTLGGDLIGSSMMSGITKGTQMIELMNAIGLDLAVVGNHEFDFGSETLKQRVAESKFPWLGTNVLGADGKTFPAIAAIVKRHEDKLDESLKVAVGTTGVELDSRRATVRVKESAIGNLIADAIREATRADVAVTNGGGIRGDRTYPAGTTLTRRDVLTELPFGNVVVLLEITGAGLRTALEEGVSAVEDVAGRFPHVSGLTFVFDPRRPKGSRVLQVQVGGKPLDPAAVYRLATNEYMMAGGDGYAALTKARPIIDPSGGALMANVVMDYIAAKGTVSPAVEGRITEQK